MNFSTEVKNELIKLKGDKPCCKLAGLSAYIRSNGSVVSSNNLVGFEISADNAAIAAYYVKILYELFGEKASSVENNDKLNNSKRVTYFCVSENSFAILEKLGILRKDDDGIAVIMNINQEIVENDCCKAAYCRGVFLGSGSITVPKSEGGKTGYHMECVFTNYQAATDFCEIMSEMYFLPKLIERKASYVVYLKNRDEICEFLGRIGAAKSYLRFTELTIEKDYKNNMNRQINCEVSNMTKQMDASIRQIRAIETIRETVGLESLDLPLRSAAEYRIKNKDATLSALAEMMGVTKSCLNHRMRKIVLIAEELN